MRNSLLALLLVCFAAAAVQPPDAQRPTSPCAVAAGRGQARRRADLKKAELDHAALEDFTSTVMDATEELHTDHIKTPNRGELVRWVVEGLYRSVGERTPNGLAERLRKVRGMKGEDLTVLVSDARKHLGKRKELEDLKDIDTALEGIFARLEPETRQPPQRECRNRFRCILRHYWPTGIGMQIRKSARSHWLEVVTPIKDGPAYQAGVMTGDIITQIAYEDVRGDRVTVHVVCTWDLSIAGAEDKLLGKPGSKVTLTISREGVANPIQIEVIRGKAEPETILGVRRRADDRWDFMLDRAHKIGYLRLRSLAAHTDRDFGRAIDSLKKQGVKELILDLRFCPGGLLVICMEIAERFVGQDLVVIVKRVGEQFPLRGQNRGGRLDLPMVCLVNGGTGRASEALAACLQDHHRAIVAGERTRGDVGIQNIFPLHGGELRFTTGVMVRPSGKNLSKLLTAGKDTEDWGIMPDKGLELKLTRAERQALLEHLGKQEIIPRRDRPARHAGVEFRDRQLDTALGHLRGRLQ